MKVFVHQGIVTAQAETEAEINKLFSFKETSSKRAYVLKKTHKKHKFKKECDICHESFKGLKLHKRIAHMTTVPPDSAQNTAGWSSLTLTK